MNADCGPQLAVLHLPQAELTKERVAAEVVRAAEIGVEEVELHAAFFHDLRDFWQEPHVQRLALSGAVDAQRHDEQAARLALAAGNVPGRSNARVREGAQSVTIIQ